MNRITLTQALALGSVTAVVAVGAAYAGGAPPTEDAAPMIASRTVLDAADPVIADRVAQGATAARGDAVDSKRTSKNRRGDAPAEQAPSEDDDARDPDDETDDVVVEDEDDYEDEPSAASLDTATATDDESADEFEDDQSTGDESADESEVDQSEDDQSADENDTADEDDEDQDQDQDQDEDEDD